MDSPTTPTSHRRASEREFALLILKTSTLLARQAPTDHARHAATRVTRRLKILLLNPN